MKILLMTILLWTTWPMSLIIINQSLNLILFISTLQHLHCFETKCWDFQIWSANICIYVLYLWNLEKEDFPQCFYLPHYISLIPPLTMSLLYFSAAKWYVTIADNCPAFNMPSCSGAFFIFILAPTRHFSEAQRKPSIFNALILFCLQKLAEQVIYCQWPL